MRLQVATAPTRLEAIPPLAQITAPEPRGADIQVLFEPTLLPAVATPGRFVSTSWRVRNVGDRTARVSLRLEGPINLQNTDVKNVGAGAIADLTVALRVPFNLIGEFVTYDATLVEGVRGIGFRRFTVPYVRPL